MKPLSHCVIWVKTLIREVPMMKKLLALFALTFALLFCTALADSSWGLTSASTSVKLRQRPSAASTELGSYSRNQWVEVISTSGNWYRVVTPDGQLGYMPKTAVTIPKITHSDIGIVTQPKAVSYLNLRQTPSYQGRVLGVYYNGAPCQLLSQSNGWYQVRIDGKTGYFRKEYLDVHYGVAYSVMLKTVVTPNRKGINFRSGPSYDADIISVCPEGTYVMVLSTGREWSLVSVNGEVGFMVTGYLHNGLLTPEGAHTPGTNNSDISYDDDEEETTQAVVGYAIVKNPKANQLLNLRETASLDGKILGQFANGTRVAVLAQGSQWCKVRVVKTGAVGYMSTQYLDLGKLPKTPMKTVTHPKRTFVNLRQAPKLTAEIRKEVPHGTKVQILIPGDVWTKVLCGSMYGYMMSVYLK